LSSAELEIASAPGNGRILPPTVLSDPRILSALSLIERDYSERPTLEAVADAAGLSLFHFHRRFAETMGETIGAYIRRTRLDWAAAAVLRTDAPLLDTALRSGYASQEAFTRAFSRQFHMTPGAMRAAALVAMPLCRQIDRDRAELVQPHHRHEEQPLIGMRFYGSYEQVPAFWRRFARQLQDAGFPLDRAQAIGLLQDDPGITGPGLVRYDCCIVDRGFPAHLVRAPLWRRRVQGPEFARIEITGPYELVAQAVLSVSLAWLPAQRKRYGDSPAYEIYDTPPWTNTDWFSLAFLMPIA
jgi:AraC family transcriptional regulator